MRATLATALAVGTMLVSAEVATPSDRVYFDTHAQLDQQRMRGAAAGFGAVADALSRICKRLATADQVVDTIPASGRAEWAKRAVRVMLRFGATVQGVDSSCQAAAKYRFVALDLGYWARTLRPTCYLVPDILPCSWTGTLRQRLEKIDRSGWFDYCRATIWSKGTTNRPMVVTYGVRSGGHCL